LRFLPIRLFQRLISVRLQDGVHPADADLSIDCYDNLDVNAAFTGEVEDWCYGWPEAVRALEVHWESLHYWREDYPSGIPARKMPERRVVLREFRDREVLHPPRLCEAMHNHDSWWKNSPMLIGGWCLCCLKGDVSYEATEKHDLQAPGEDSHTPFCFSSQEDLVSNFNKMVC
jgi:hypothetical protein